MVLTDQVQRDSPYKRRRTRLIEAKFHWTSWSASGYMPQRILIAGVSCLDIRPRKSLVLQENKNSRTMNYEKN